MNDTFNYDDIVERHEENCIKCGKCIGEVWIDSKEQLVLQTDPLQCVFTNPSDEAVFEFMCEEYSDLPMCIYLCEQCFFEARPSFDIYQNKRLFKHRAYKQAEAMTK
jgi:ferredoxin